MPYSIEQRDEQLLNTSANILYTLGFERAPQHLVSVTMRVQAITGPDVVLVMPSWTPGSYKIRDYAGLQGNVRAYSVRGTTRTPVAFHWRDKASLVVQTNGSDTIEVDYVVYGYERTVRTNHINRWHAFVVPAATCMYVEGRQDEIHHVALTHAQSEWPHVSTALSPVRKGDVTLLGALNYDILVDSPLEIGDHIVRTFEAEGAKHELALVTNHNVDADWLVEQLKTIVSTEAAIFGGVPYDRYVFVLHCFPGNGGGLEHARSSINGTDPQTLLDKSKAIDLLSLLCHEYFHLWNVKRIRPVELGPFDYTRERYTSMLWLAEGLTSYYDDLLAYRCGFTTEKAYLEGIAKDHFGKLARVPGRAQMSVKDSSYLAWLKLYFAPAPDASNRFPSYYLKGGVIFLLLDLYIIDHTDAQRSLDDGLRAMWEQYRTDPSKGLTEPECIAIIERATGVQVREMLQGWLDGTEELPHAEILAAMGLTLELKPPSTSAITFGENRTFASVQADVMAGWTCADVNGRIIVRAVEDGGPAQRAGIGVDDEILAVNDKRVASPAHLDRLMAEQGGTAARITAHCDGRLYTTSVTCVPTATFTLTESATLTEHQLANRKRWLHR
jgi:predicted metalloprotease with PDZ domain